MKHRLANEEKGVIEWRLTDEDGDIHLNARSGGDWMPVLGIEDGATHIELYRFSCFLKEIGLEVNDKGSVRVEP